MDTAKVADAVFTHGGSARDQEGFLLMPREDDGRGRPLDIAPLACIPTTAGTGSEVSMAAVIRDPEAKIKLEIADFPLFPRLAILDPETTRTLPARVAAATGMDAMTHAIEGYVSAHWNPHQDARSLHALRLMRDNLARAVETPEDEDARGNMLIAANLAITIELGSVHAMSHPAGAIFGVPHGVANAIHLPHVIRFNAEGGPDIAARYGDLADVLGVAAGTEVGDALAEHVTELVARLGLPTRLSEVGVPESGVAQLVEGAIGDGTTLLNPREAGEEEYAELYRRAL
jgi:alcohol dehydrogenase